MLRRALIFGVLTLVLVTSACTENAPPPQASPSPRTSATGTVEPRTNGTFTFAVIGDFGTGDDAALEVASRVRAWTQSHSADALVTTGDNVYPDGSPEYFDAAWREPYGWVQSSGIDVIASLGNHDVLTEEGTAVMELLEMPGRWYSKRIGAARLFVIDANRVDDPRQLTWLRRSLARSTVAWEIVVFHQPFFSCSIHRNTTRVQASLNSIFQARKVDLVLNGHDHNYQRFGPRGGTAFVVTGGAGASLYRMHVCPPGTPPPVVSDTEQHHFVVVTGDSEALRVRALGMDGSVIDDFYLRRPG